ncbi:MAG TPA: pyridoxal-dependent decarboxylase [Geothrix sp.]|nr:pyridoxal-dependent decarboxylase [Geothrix sp.]
MNPEQSTSSLGTHGLDPEDWASTRRQAHRMLDDLFDHLEGLRGGPVWRPMPAEVRGAFDEALPLDPLPLEAVHAAFLQRVLPYSVGNLHPGFMGWVHGGGNVAGMLGEMLAGGLNANLGGRDHAPMEVERQVLRWVRSIFGFPDSASGLFVTGTSLANFLGLLVARHAALEASGPDSEKKLVAYASAAVHGCVPRALDMGGLGREALRLVPTNGQGQMRLDALEAALRRDREAGLRPFFLVGTAGSVDIGAVDDLAGLADLATHHGLWFHVDGAFGALAVLAPSLAPRLAGLERADSLAFDFHKWGQVPYDAGYLLVRDGAKHLETFTAPAAYLQRETRGLAAGSPWPCDFGPDLSRGFRALKTWFTLKTHGLRRLGAMIEGTCALARHLEARIGAEPSLELMAPVALNIVCFRHRGSDPDALNARIAVEVQESGLAAPSTTRLAGGLALRAAIVNHRTQVGDVEALVNAVLEAGRRLAPQPR